VQKLFVSFSPAVLFKKRENVSIFLFLLKKKDPPPPSSSNCGTLPAGAPAIKTFTNDVAMLVIVTHFPPCLTFEVRLGA
jgi:hypothetical protein